MTITPRTNSGNTKKPVPHRRLDTRGKRPLLMPADCSTSAINSRIRAYTANKFFGTGLELRLVKLLGITEKAASELINGDRPYTPEMLAVIASKVDTSPGYLLSGQKGVRQPSSRKEDLYDDEVDLLDGYTKLDQDGKNAVLFVLGMCDEHGFLSRVSSDIRVRILGSTAKIIASNTLPDHMINSAGNALHMACDRYLVQPEDYANVAPINTPLHILFGQTDPQAESINGHLPGVFD